MIIANQKKRENIAEYILYMWQIEDIIRACNLDIDVIKKNMIEKFSQPDDIKMQMTEWYENLIAMIKNEKKEISGHISIISVVVEDLNDLHLRLLQDPKEIQYNTLFYKTLPYLIDLRNNTKANAMVSDIELALNALYGVLLLRLQKKEITKETSEAISQISSLLAFLSKKYKEDEES